MSTTQIDIKDIIKGKYSYPSWSTNSSYPLEYEDISRSQTVVYYVTKSNKRISKVMPKFLCITPELAYVLGLIKGEGANSLGKSNYRRFTFTNTDGFLIKKVIDILDGTGLYHKKDLPKNSFHILHFTEKEELAIDYWSKQLKQPPCRFRCFDEKIKTRPYGVCHLYISDVLLRRVIDLLGDFILSDKKA